MWWSIIFTRALGANIDFCHKLPRNTSDNSPPVQYLSLSNDAFFNSNIVQTQCHIELVELFCSSVFGQRTILLSWFVWYLGIHIYTITLIEFYFIMIFIMIVVTIIGIFIAINYLLIYILGFLYLSTTGSANARLPWCFRPWTFSLNIGLNMFPLDPFMSCLHSLLEYSTGEFQDLQLFVLAAFGAVD